MWVPHNILALTHWGRVMYISISELSIIGSDNGLSPGRRQATIWTNTIWTNIVNWTPGNKFQLNIIEIHIFSFKKMHLKRSSAKRRPFCLGLNVLRTQPHLHDSTHIDHAIDLQTSNLTHCGLVMPYGDRDLGQHWLRCLTATSHYLNQCWLIISDVQWYSY